MPAYAVAIVRETRFGPEVKRYLEQIDDTLGPHLGRFLVHGGPYQPLEGHWSGDLIVIEFPSLGHANAWYNSAAYQAIKALRTDHTEGDLFLVHGAPAGHRASDILE